MDRNGFVLFVSDVLLNRICVSKLFHPATRNRCSTELIHTATKQSYSINRYKTFSRKNVFRTFEIQIKLSLKNYSQSSINEYKATDLESYYLSLICVVRPYNRYTRT